MKPLRLTIRALLLSVACCASETPKEQVERLMSAGLPIAQQSVRDEREMAPFAFVMTSRGEVRRVSSSEESRPQASQAGIDALVRSLREGATEEDYRAIAIFVDTSIEPPSGGRTTPAIEVMLEHRGGYCANAFFPYSRAADGGVAFQGFFAAPRPGSVFGGCNAE